jgi:hypothetical protein
VIRRHLQIPSIWRAPARFLLVSGTIALLIVATHVVLQSVRASSGSYRPQQPDPTYATQVGSQADVRAQHLDNLAEELTDSTYEACEVRTVRQWGVILDSAPNPEAVSRRFAAVNYPPAERPGARAGCRNALIDQLAVRSGP